VFYQGGLLARVSEVHPIINTRITTVLHLLARMWTTLGDYIGVETVMSGNLTPEQ